MKEPYDLIIIGCGIAAQSVLYGLTPGYKGRICIIEVSEHRQSKVRFQTRNSPISVAKRKVRAFGVGGTSNIWGGNLIPFTRLEIDRGGWGLSSRELMSFLPSALKVLGFQGYVNEVVNDWEGYINSEGSSQFAIQAQYRQASQANRAVQPHRTGVKFDLETGLFAEKLERLSEGWEVLATDRLRNVHRIVGRRVVIANGNLEALRLMQKSGLNQSDAFGKYWSGHLQLVAGTFSTREKIPLETRAIGQVIRQEFFHLPYAADPGHSAWKVQLFSVRNSLLTFLQLAPQYSLVALFRLLVDSLAGRRTYFLNLDGDQIPTPDSRVSFTRSNKLEILHCATQKELDSLSHALRLLETMEQNGKFSTFSKSTERLLKTSKTSSHQLGGARIGGSARDGVVDQNLEVYGSPCIFVCSTAVFRSYSAANPTLMLCQLGLRLGQHLLSLSSSDQRTKPPRQQKFLGMWQPES